MSSRFFLLILGILVINFDKIHSRRKPRIVEPCKYIEISSKGGISTKYPDYLGVYERQKNKVNGKYSYFKHTTEQALWWSTDADSWKIGNVKFMGTNKGNLYNAKDICKGKFVDLLSPDCYPWWKFWDADDNGDTQWTYDNSVNVECFDLYYNIAHNEFCSFPGDPYPVFLQDVERYEDLGQITRDCDQLQAYNHTCSQFYFSALEKAYYICPDGSEIQPMKGYLRFTPANAGE